MGIIGDVKEAPQTETELLHRRNRELSILKDIAETLNRSVDLDQALTAALALVADLLDLQTGWVWLLHPTHGETYLAAAQNLPPGLIRHPELMQGTCYCLDAYQAGDLAGAANISVITCSRLKKLVDGSHGLRYHASIALYAQEKPLGVLNVASTDWRELTADDLRILHTLGDMLSIAIERARLFADSAEYGAAEERNRLAREIHDTLAQGLAGVALQLETADALLQAGQSGEQLHNSIGSALTLTRASLEEARRSVLDLRAKPLEGRTLLEAIWSLVQEFEQNNRVSLELDAPTGLQPLSARVEIGIYRILQEALTNIQRHAHADHVWIHIQSNPGNLVLQIRDDGVGFDPTRLLEGRFGLLGLNERVRLLGGNLNLESNPGVGTFLGVTIPTG